jgi:hypothetical protein
MRIFAAIVLIAALIFAYVRIDQRPAWSSFLMSDSVPAEMVENADKNTSTKKNLKGESVKNEALSFHTDWVSDSGLASVHAASSIILQDGKWRAFWFAGSREGASDVVIQSALFDPVNKIWSDMSVVVNRQTIQKSLGRSISKIGNPLPVRANDGRLQLYFVTVSIGGWAGSSISVIESWDDGVTWGPARRLITSPVFNLSTLVKAPAFAFQDGTIGLPVYHEWVGKYGEFLRLQTSEQGVELIDKRRMSSGRGTLQPIILIRNQQSADAYFRQARSQGPKKVTASHTVDAGQSWQLCSDLEVPNPNSAIAGLTLSNQTRLLVLNDLDEGRHRLVMMASWPQNLSDKENTVLSYGPWRVVQILEDDSESTANTKQEFSYPYLAQSNQGDVLLLYTWNRKRIREAYFPAAELRSYLARQALLVPDTMPPEGK